MVQFRNDDEKGERPPEESGVPAEVSNKRAGKAASVEDDNITRLAVLAVVSVGVALVEVELLAGVALGAAAMLAPQIIKAFRSGKKQAEKDKEGAAAVVGASEPNTDTFHEAVKKIVSSAPEEPEELKQKLFELALELDRIKDRIPPDALPALKADVEKLAHEATKAKRESMLRTSGEGILAVLKVADEAAAPAAKLIPEILEAVVEL
jgi:hypothetical protein